VDWGFLEIINISNSGAAFGIFQGHSPILAVIDIIGMVLVVLIMIFSDKYVDILSGKLRVVALGMVLGGTAGNLYDRFHFGAITDFIDFKIWPAFNAADASVSVAVLIIIYLLIRSAFTTEQKEKN
jgi:signal peptidase II